MGCRALLVFLLGRCCGGGEGGAVARCLMRSTGSARTVRVGGYKVENSEPVLENQCTLQATTRKQLDLCVAAGNCSRLEDSNHVGISSLAFCETVSGFTLHNLEGIIALFWDSISTSLECIST